MRCRCSRSWCERPVTGSHSTSDVREAMEDAGINPSGNERKNIGCVLGLSCGMKNREQFFSRLNYGTVDKVLTKMGLPPKDVEVAVAKYKAH